MDDTIFKTEIDRCREQIYGNPGRKGERWDELGGWIDIYYYV